MHRTFRTFFTMTFCAVLLAGGLVISEPDTFCSEKDPNQRQIGPTKTTEVTIQKKMSASLLTKELAIVRVSRHTEYVDQSGRKMPYDLLSVPCKAVIVYEPEPNGNPVAVNVTVKQLLPGASRLIEVVPK